MSRRVFMAGRNVMHALTEHPLQLIQIAVSQHASSWYAAMLLPHKCSFFSSLCFIDARRFILDVRKTEATVSSAMNCQGCAV